MACLWNKVTIMVEGLITNVVLACINNTELKLRLYNVALL